MSDTASAWYFFIQSGETAERREALAIVLIALTGLALIVALTVLSYLLYNLFRIVRKTRCGCVCRNRHNNTNNNSFSFVFANPEAGVRAIRNPIEAANGGRGGRAQQLPINLLNLDSLSELQSPPAYETVVFGRDAAPQRSQQDLQRRAEELHQQLAQTLPKSEDVPANIHM